MCTGVSTDYIKGIYKKIIVYTYELRDRSHYGFLLPPNQIIPSEEETLDSLVSIFQETKIRGYPSKSKRLMTNQLYLIFQSSH